MTRTITVTQAEPRMVAMVASEADESIERLLRRAVNALPPGDYRKYETAKLAPLLQERGWVEVREGVTAVLTENMGNLPGDNRIEHGEFIVELAKGDEPVPEYVSIDHPLLLKLNVYRHTSVDDETYIVIDIDADTEKPPVRVYINDGPVFIGESADEREEN